MDDLTASVDYFYITSFIWRHSVAIFRGTLIQRLLLPLNYLTEQEIARLLWKPKVNFRVHSMAPLHLPRAGLLQPAQSYPPLLLKISFNITLPSMTRSPNYLSFPTENLFALDVPSLPAVVPWVVALCALKMEASVGKNQQYYRMSQLRIPLDAISTPICNLLTFLRPRISTDSAHIRCKPICIPGCAIYMEESHIMELINR